MRQVHGAKVLVAGSQLPAANALEPWSETGDGAPPEADAVASSSPGLCLAVLSADCATVALGSGEGVYAAVHVGWRGLVSGVVESAIASMRSLGARGLYAGIGPCVHACCYEFDAPELETIVGRYGSAVRALTRAGAPALDLPAAVKKALSAQEVEVALDADVCTGCAKEHYFSYRSRAETQRQALFVWLDPATSVNAKFS